MTPLRNLPLSSLTTFGVAASAARAWALERTDQIDSLLDAVETARRRTPDDAAAWPFVLGGGSNVLFARDLAEPLILVRLRGIRVADDDGAGVLLEVGAGEVWDDLVRYTLSRGWFGLENLSLIPGLVGGAPWQNIGAYGVEVAEFLDAVQAVHLGSGRRRTFNAGECGFGYRSSFFKSPEGRGWLITAVRLRLSRQAQPRTGYGELAQEVAALAGSGSPLAAAGPPPSPASASPTSPTPQLVAEAVRSLRRRKLPDPAIVGNAGSFFKNPTVSRDQGQSLRKAEPQAPLYPVPDDAARVKLSAGWLIERAGWKGFREGDAGVSTQHALVLVNHGNASGRQLLALAERIRQSVLERFDVALEPEPVIVA